jgi:putative two-component system response regulator
MSDISDLPTILVIDDEAAIRQSFADYLEDRDFCVLTAENGHVGLELLAREQLHLVLVDLRMPGMDGFEFIRQCRPRAPHLPVIVISGANRAEEADEARSLGAADYLSKPLEDLSVLGQAVDRALERA